jgi:flagellum-specific peptidoglycan hydrolase FlgJ
MNKSEWIQSIATAARNASSTTGMSFELMLAQAAQETGWGQKILPGTNNIFNIKADSSWTGAVKTFQVPEFINGQWITVSADFRVYPTIEQAFVDRVSFLQSNPRYVNAGLFNPGVLGDLKAEATALQAAGYATDPSYANNLVAVFAGPTMQSALKLLDRNLAENFQVDVEAISGLKGWWWSSRIDNKTGDASSKVLDPNGNIVLNPESVTS